MMLGRKKPEQPQRRSADLGIKRAPVFSYYSSRHPNSSGQSTMNRNALDGVAAKRDRHMPWWINYLPSLVAVSVVFCSVLYVSTLSTKPRIEIVAGPKPTAAQNITTYEQAAQEELGRSLLNRSKLTINSDIIAEALKVRFPELGEVVVHIPLISRRPIIKVQPATPALIVSGQGGTYIIDITGRPVLRANSLPSSVRDNLPIVSDDSGSAIELGAQLMTTDLVTFIGQVSAQFRANEITVEAYTLPALANELHVALQGQNYYIKFNTEVDARQQVGTYLAVKERLESEGRVPVEYIDVRVEERAYIK